MGGGDTSKLFYSRSQFFIIVKKTHDTCPVGTAAGGWSAVYFLTIASHTFPAWLSNWEKIVKCDISQVLGLLTKLSNG